MPGWEPSLQFSFDRAHTSIHSFSNPIQNLQEKFIKTTPQKRQLLTAWSTAAATFISGFRFQGFKNYMNCNSNREEVREEEEKTGNMVRVHAS